MSASLSFFLRHGLGGRVEQYTDRLDIRNEGILWLFFLTLVYEAMGKSEGYSNDCPSEGILASFWGD